MIDINSIDDEQILSNTLVGAMEYTLKHGRKDNVLEQLDQLKETLQVIIKTKKIKGIDYIRQILWYNIKKISQAGEKKLDRVLADIIKDKINREEIMGLLVEKWYNEGKAEGKAETVQKMLLDNLDVITISRYTGLDTSKISEIQNGN